MAAFYFVQTKYNARRMLELAQRNTFMVWSLVQL